MSLGLAGAAAAGERPGPPAALRPERSAPERAQPRFQPPPAAATPGPAIEGLAPPRLARAQFLIHELLAAAPELGPGPAGRPRMLAAYQAQLAHRIRYFGPISPVDLRV